MSFEDMFPGASTSGIPTFKDAAERNHWKYNRMLDGYLHIVDVWAGLSLAVNDGEITLQEMKDKFDNFLAEKAIIGIMLDNLRKREAAANADQAVEKFREVLDSAPTADEPKYDL